MKLTFRSIVTDRIPINSKKIDEHWYSLSLPKSISPIEIDYALPTYRTALEVAKEFSGLFSDLQLVHVAYVKLTEDTILQIVAFNRSDKYLRKNSNFKTFFDLFIDASSYYWTWASDLLPSNQLIPTVFIKG